MRSAEEIVDTAANLGLHRIAAELRAAVLASLRFDLMRAVNPPANATRIGGAPAMPAVLSWPEWRDQPLIFIAQIALRDLADTAIADLLPGDGVLSFWYAGADTRGVYPAESGAARVLYFSDGKDLVERPPPEGMPHDGPLSACTWIPRGELTIPPWESAIVEGWQLSKDELDKYFALQDALGVGEDLTIHRLLGHPDPVQGDMQLEC